MCLKKRIFCIIVSILMLVSFISIPLYCAVKGAALTDYEAYLSSEGFPQSYWAGLKALHEAYPQWIFKAQQISLDWNDVVTAESSVGRNLVAKSSINSWKSFEYGAYNWTAKDYVGFDGSSWISASKELITYYLDPRSFINSSTIFIFLNQSYDSSTQSLSGINQMISGTFLDNAFPEEGYSTYSDVILAAAQQSGVNPYVLASSIIQEQGSDGSGVCISGTYSGYEGIYNYFNIGAYVDDGLTAVQRGLKFAAGGFGVYTYGRPWNSRAKSIIYGAIYYGSSYVNAGQNTLYYKKFNVVNNTTYNYYSHQYMTNIQGAESEAKTLKKAYANVMDTALTFTIPVYNNMSDTAAVKPTSTGNNNNWLSSLSVDGYSLTPTFDMFTTSYDLIVDKNTDSIHINAATSDSGASIVSATDVSLADGDNTVNIVVQAPSGSQRTYTLSVYKEPNPDGQTTTTPSLSSSSYTIDTSISNVQPDCSVSDFTANLSVSNASLNVVDSSGNAKSGNMATGDILQVIQNNSVYASYEISVNGDINGDGKLSAYDLLQVQRHILSFSTLSDARLLSADYNKDGKISSYDLLQIQRYILKL